MHELSLANVHLRVKGGTATLDDFKKLLGLFVVRRVIKRSAAGKYGVIFSEEAPKSQAGTGHAFSAFESGNFVGRIVPGSPCAEVSPRSWSGVLMFMPRCKRK